jgi:hypothetical protein
MFLDTIVDDSERMGFVVQSGMYDWLYTKVRERDIWAWGGERS